MSKTLPGQLISWCTLLLYSLLQMYWIINSQVISVILFLPELESAASVKLNCLSYLKNQMNLGKGKWSSFFPSALNLRGAKGNSSSPRKSPGLLWGNPEVLKWKTWPWGLQHIHLSRFLPLSSWSTTDISVRVISFLSCVIKSRAWILGDNLGWSEIRLLMGNALCFLELSGPTCCIARPQDEALC